MGREATTLRTRRVEVKLGPRGRALRIDGTFASWYEPGSAITGSVWDALAAPLLLLPRQRRKRVLILGLGGGSAARVVRALAPRARIVGVELDAQVVRAAQRWFDLDQLGVEVVRDDAQSYLERTRRCFDAIVEDVFIGRGRAVRKPDWLPTPGLERAARRLAHGGVLVSNAIDESAAVTRAMCGLFPSALRIEVEDYDNQIVVGAAFPLSGRVLRIAVARSPILGPTARRLRFRAVRSARVRRPEKIKRRRIGTAARRG